MNLQIDVDNDDTIRTDIVSKDVETIFFDLPTSPDWSSHHEYVRKRRDYVRALDTQAYNSIKDRFPLFLPPGHMEDKSTVVFNQQITSEQQSHNILYTVLRWLKTSFLSSETSMK